MKLDKYVAVLALVACSDQNGLPTEPVRLDDTWLYYREDHCFEVHPPDQELGLPGDTLLFACGVVAIEFQDSTTWNDANAVIADIPQAHLKNWFPANSMLGPWLMWVTLHVPVGTEKPAIERARRHAKVKWAGLVHVRISPPPRLF